jgi:hypothetical protein
MGVAASLNDRFPRIGQTDKLRRAEGTGTHRGCVAEVMDAVPIYFARRGWRTLRHGRVASTRLCRCPCTARRVPNADIVVTDVEGARLCSIQVKTRRDIGSDGGWHMNAKHETIRSDRLFYCFVDFGKATDTRPVVHVLPSVCVAEVLSATHRKWRANPGRHGRPHKDNPMRRLLPDYSNIFGPTDNPYPMGWLDKYRDAWRLLQLECGEVESAAEA